MLSIFRRNSKDTIKKMGKDTSIAAEEITDQIDETTEGDGEVQTTLSIHPSWDLPNEQQYVFRFLHNELEPLKPNQISLSGIEINNVPSGNGIEVTAFIRNSLSKALKMGNVTLILFDENDKPVARNTYDFGIIGEIPAHSSRPWAFHFPANTLVTKEFSRDNWTLAFELQGSNVHSLDLDDRWNESLSDDQKKNLEEIFNRMPLPKKGQVNFMGFQANQAENRDLTVSLFIQNGHNQDFHLEQLPLVVKDQSGEVIAEGTFKLGEFVVKANTSKPWSFHFPANLLKKEQLDLTSWSIEIPGT
jgi:accessory Sec system S-layer assembly protein